MSSRLGRAAIVASLAIAAALPLGCHKMTEQEALEAAREEVREEMQPEIDRRRREIEELKRQVEATRARLAARKARQGRAPSP
ncbi:MAG: hypothetical protein L0Z52_06470 [Acidobacteria bacterium]|nr:hypothetical protein [Acidobacteriota bacterium]